MQEQYGILLLATGALLGVVGYLWLIVLGFRISKLWGLAVVVFPPAALLLISRSPRSIYIPLVFVLLGLVLPAPIVLGIFAPKLEPYESIVDGERHVTLTGWGEGKDYHWLDTKRDIVVLQMANADVSDQTLLIVKELKQLRELDLNDTQITDEGLAALKELPQLRVLRIARPKLTEKGFRDHILPLKELNNLDVRQTTIPGKALREWKNQRPEERKYLN